MNLNVFENCRSYYFRIFLSQFLDVMENSQAKNGSNQPATTGGNAGRIDLTSEELIEYLTKMNVLKDVIRSMYDLYCTRKRLKGMTVEQEDKLKMQGLLTRVKKLEERILTEMLTRNHSEVGL